MSALKLKRIAKWTGAILGVAFVVIQFVPVDRTNPPVESEVPASPEVLAVLRRACYDCHSNETVWPWYSHVAPMSWLVAKDVREGREEMNFSTWGSMSAKRQAKKMHECWEEVEDEEMPLWFYLPLHPEARLSDADMTLIRDWSQSVASVARDEG